MRYRNFLPVVVFCCLLTNPARARIGETLDQCVARYGKATDVGEGFYSFEKDGFLVGATLFKGKVDFITFEKPGPPPVALTPEEIQTVLKNDGGGRTWKAVKGGPAFVAWQTTDNALIAHYGLHTFSLNVYTRESEARTTAALNAPSPNSVPKGF